MASLEEIRKNRLQKLELLKKAGVNPYPISSNVEMSLAELEEQFLALSAANKKVTVGGRLMSRREQGAVCFVDLYDGTAKFQTLFSKDKTENFDLFIEASDIGDFIEVAGTLFVTTRGQHTVEVKSWRMLSKSLRPLPEKWHGLQDVEERFRKRYLDTLMSTESRERFVLRSKIISGIRKILEEKSFMEVETPMLQAQAGGANAEPFSTHHNALDSDLYLRIAPELYLKRLLVGGFPKVYEIGRNFRNEGIDVTHNPEFTMLEYYESFSDAEKQMEFVEQMFKKLSQDILGESTLSYDDKKIDLGKKFKRISYGDLFKNTDLDIDSSDLEEVKDKAEELKIKIDKGDSREKILDSIYKKVIRPNIADPTFIIDYPADYIPLAKKKDDNPKLVNAFQLVIGGMELVKAFSELNDPIDQRERFEVQEKNRRAGDKEAQSMDEDYIEALEYGLPPAGGVGIGIDRLVMLFTNSRNIREVILFPTLRPKS